MYYFCFLRPWNYIGTTIFGMCVRVCVSLGLTLGYAVHRINNNNNYYYYYYFPHCKINKDMVIPQNTHIHKRKKHKIQKTNKGIS